MSYSFDEVYRSEMTYLKEQLTRIREIVPIGSKIVYIDFPIHENVGDLLIMLGTEKFFKDNQYNVINRYSHQDFNRFQRQKKIINIPKDCIIVFHGGGNLGDLYHGPQEFRSSIIKQFPSNKIVIFPQTIYFEKTENMLKTFETYKQHPDLHLFVRDSKSYSMANKYLDNVYNSPDMAHQLFPLQRKNKKVKKENLYFIRKDIEINTLQNKIQFDNENNYDWSLVLNIFDKKMIGLFGKLHSSRFSNLSAVQNFIHLSWYYYSKYLIKKGINLFVKYDKITTSRLHGHILASLLGIENYLIDNSYGKNVAYYEKWTKNVNVAKLLK